MSLGFGAAMIYSMLKAKGGAAIPAPRQQPSLGWTQQYGSVSVAQKGPSHSKPHYIVDRAAAGQTINMRFRVDGNGTLVPCGYGPHLTLYIQRAGDNLGGAGLISNIGNSAAVPLGRCDIAFCCPLNWGMYMVNAVRSFRMSLPQPSNAAVGFVFGNPAGAGTW
jgi:hypothetical protein